MLAICLYFGSTSPRLMTIDPCAAPAVHAPARNNRDTHAQPFAHVPRPTIGRLA